jgi:hypothetical protein
MQPIAVRGDVSLGLPPANRLELLRQGGEIVGCSRVPNRLNTSPELVPGVQMSVLEVFLCFRKCQTHPESSELGHAGLLYICMS